MEENKVMSNGVDSAVDLYENDFCPYIFRWGGILNALAMIIVFLPPVVLLLMGYDPDWGAFAAACAIQLPLVASAAFTEPFAYFPALGPAGAYLGYLSGNCSNMRLPCAFVAQEAADVEQGSPEGSIISTVGVVVSIIVSTVILTIGAVSGQAIVGALSPKMLAALNLLLPALFAAILANAVANKPKLALIIIPCAIVIKALQKYGALNFMPKPLLMTLVPLVLAFGSMAIAVGLYKKGKL